jgi:dihydroxy-acid dehydratase
MELNKYSKTITQDETQPAAQTMLYGIGLTENDLKESSSWNCKHGLQGNLQHAQIGKRYKTGVWKEDLVGLILV